MTLRVHWTHEHTTSPVDALPSQKTRSDHGISSVHGSRDGSSQRFIAGWDEDVLPNPVGTQVPLLALLWLLLCVKKPAGSSSRNVSGVVGSKKLAGKSVDPSLLSPFQCPAGPPEIGLLNVVFGCLSVSILSVISMLDLAVIAVYAFDDVGVERPRLLCSTENSGVMNGERKHSRGAAPKRRAAAFHECCAMSK
ncbi:hypothetical protein PC129_g3216 [Phytophthora cactorum]|uniref:Uncharacterized protein n=1 Tax=Phytophthora cactorum TaxID=29920 RepID=A0A8T1DR29_9STRA|nr:hypothetical protein PC111_g925 [Phytophthora cactorum]KAG2847904.1 hypothetical protein PC112_g909 [Phytophthora cactorum]KAG2867114.1 hypothetical protein PC113_g2261 [Phytophthora cactorum]KAG2942041.1 hypothetical protein PC115_g1632 [Phytophthora cactorum]KAG3039963.1 hypothetical protein PC119_g1747 [Phytophthora cactorum]